MNQHAATTCIFIDIGGVLLSNGWDRDTRNSGADIFRLALDIAQDGGHAG